MSRRRLGSPANYPRPLVDEAGQVIPLRRKMRVRLMPGRLDDLCWAVRSKKGRCRDDYVTVPLITGVQVVAHRHAWVAQHGREVPAGMVIHHRCFTKACVNPAHLELVTFGENSRLSNFAERYVETARAAA